MNTYLKAIARNGHLFKGKVCLDVGCGLGVRSMALVRAGATHVYAVEDSCIITQTRKIIAANNMEDKITLIDVSMKEVRLPGPVDVLVSMWMGEALLYKCSLADVLFARDRWLKADGIMFPSRASLYLVGIEMPMATEHEFWWSNVYGFDLSSVGVADRIKPQMMSVHHRQAITQSCRVLRLNLMECSRRDLTFNMPFEFAALEDATLHAIAAYFDIDFTFCHTDVYFSTGPQYPPTRWRQTVFPLDTPLNLLQNAVVEGTFGCTLEANAPGSSSSPTHATFLLPKSEMLVVIPPETDGKKRKTDADATSANRDNANEGRRATTTMQQPPSLAPPGLATPPQHGPAKST